MPLPPPPDMHVPLIEKHPFSMLRPFAKVLEAVTDEDIKNGLKRLGSIPLTGAADVRIVPVVVVASRGIE